jgi:hypothetical protein
MLDSVLRWIVVIVPTAFGVVCAMQALRPPKSEHHKRWLFIFIVAGVVGSAAVLWQQARTARDSDEQRKELQNQITDAANRVLFQIRDLSVSFRIRIPLDHPALRDYRERVERCAEDMLRARDYKCGATAKTTDPENMAISNFYIVPHSELYPRQNTELIAHTLLSHVKVEVHLFRAATKVQQVGHSLENADLKFSIYKNLDGRDNANPSHDTMYVALYYDIPSKSLFMQGFRVPPDETTLQTNGNITSAPDLRTATLRVQPRISLVRITGNDRGFQLTQEWLTAYEISKTASLDYFAIHMSNGYESRFLKDRLGESLTDEWGFRFYLAKF